MFSVLVCVSQAHDLRLVAVAALICAIACVAAFGFHLRARRTAIPEMQWAWIGLTGLVAGSGVWATHFIAMLAYQPSLRIGYDEAGTAASLAIAVLGMGAGFALPVVHSGRWTAVAGGALTGLAVGAMHFTGIAAMRTQASVGWDVGYVVAALIVGVAGAAGAFAAFERSARLRWAAAAGLLLLSIVGLHFTAMTAVTLTPDPRLALPVGLVDRGALAVATVALTGIVMAAALALIWMEGQGRLSALKGLRRALDVVPSALSFYDERGRLVSWNRAYAELMTPYGAAPRMGMRRQDFVDAALAAGWRTVDGERGLESRREVAHERGSTEMGLRTPEGRWLRHEAFPTQGGGGVTVLTDVTDLQARAAALAEARDAAEAANRAKTRFLANMSHEIRTPLNGVLGVADLLAGGELSGRQRELVEVIRTSGGHLNAVLTDLLDLARVEAGAVELRPEPVELETVVGFVANLFSAQAGEKGVSLITEIAPEAAGWVSCDATRLRQVLGNLVSNAVKFTDAGHVTVRVRREGDRLDFEVRDTGDGIDAAAKARIFGRFQQGDDSATRRHGGAGLGLALCQEYLRLMGGALTCETAPGQGSTFAFSLMLPPIARPEPEDLGPLAPPPGPPGRFRVLVVDDNAVNRQVLGLILDAAGMEQVFAENGREAVEAVAVDAFDAVLMDIQMPVMDGLEATRRIRAWEREAGRPHLPIYIVSANCLQEHVDAGFAAGADGHLAKPVSVAELIGALEPYAAAKLAA